MPRTGRPSKLTPDIVQTIVQAIRAGNYIETAARFAGISKVTLYEWMKRGHAARSGVYRDFLNAIEKALADSETRDLLAIDQAIRGGTLVAKQTTVTETATKKGTTTTRTVTTESYQPPQWQAAAWRLERKFADRWGRKDSVNMKLIGELEKALATLRDNLPPDDYARVYDILAAQFGTAAGATDSGVPVER